MKIYFRFERGEDLYSDVVEVPDEKLVGLDSIERQEFINNEYLEWLSQHIEFDWEVVETEESE